MTAYSPSPSRSSSQRALLGPSSPNPSSSPPTIGELLHRACAGEDEAFTDAFDRHLPDLRRHIEQRTVGALRGRIESDDLILETYLAALRRLEDFGAGEARAFGRWLTCIADLCLADAEQRLAPFRPIEPESQRGAPAGDATEAPAATPDTETAPRPEVFADRLRRRELIGAATAAATEEEAFAASWDGAMRTTPLEHPEASPRSLPWDAQR